MREFFPYEAGQHGVEAAGGRISRRTRRTGWRLGSFAGVPLFEISRYVGHTDTRMTANTYGRLGQGQEHEAARRLDDLLSGRGARKLRES